MTNEAEKKRRIGWDWLWFLPVCALLLLLPEHHTVQQALIVCKLAYQRWSWAAIFSPSAYFCVGVIVASVLWPIYGLLLTAVALQNEEVKKKRYVYAFFVTTTILLLPFVTDALTWGSFPFNIDNQGFHRLRMIPFFPWPDGGYGNY
jgi:hypothetical protein